MVCPTKTRWVGSIWFPRLGIPAGQTPHCVLVRLARRMRQWGVSAAVDGLDGLIFVIRTADASRDEMAKTLRRIVTGLSMLGQTVRAAAAPNPEAARALARHGEPCEVCGPSALRVRVAMLPLAVLRLEAAATDGLHGLGLRCIGDLMLLQRHEVPARVGSVGQALGIAFHRIDAMIGGVPERPKSGGPGLHHAKRDAGRPLSLRAPGGPGGGGLVSMPRARLFGALQRSGDRAALRPLPCGLPVEFSWCDRPARYATPVGVIS